MTDFELSAAVTGTQRDIADPHVVCFDDRAALERQPVRAKMAGGNLTTGFAAAELAGWSRYTRTALAASLVDRLAVVAGYLVQAGEKPGGHVDNRATEEKCNCGAADGYLNVLRVMGEHGGEREFIVQMEETLGGRFDRETWGQIVTRAAQGARPPGESHWSGWTIIETIKGHGGIVEVLDGGGTNSERDPTSQRHNHWAEGLVINNVPGRSNDRDTESLRYFQFDMPKILELCRKMGADHAEYSALLHAATGYQFGVRYLLTREMRNVVLLPRAAGDNQRNNTGLLS